MLGGHCCRSAIRVTDVGIVWICPKELHLVNEGLHFAGTDVTLKEHRTKSSQPSGDRASSYRSSSKTEEAFVRSLVSSGTE